MEYYKGKDNAWPTMLGIYNKLTEWFHKMIHEKLKKFPNESRTQHFKQCSRILKEIIVSAIEEDEWGKALSCKENEPDFDLINPLSKASVLM